MKKMLINKLNQAKEERKEIPGPNRIYIEDKGESIMANPDVLSVME